VVVLFALAIASALNIYLNFLAFLVLAAAVWLHVRAERDSIDDRRKS
jgi:hypothetical protein